MPEPQITIDPSLLGEFIDESVEMLATLDTVFVSLEKDPTDVSLVETIFRPVHSIKGNAAFFGFMRTKQLAHELETLLDLIRKQQLSANSEVIDVLLRGTDRLRALLDEGRGGTEDVLDEDGLTALLQQVQSATSGKTHAARRWKDVFAALDSLEHLPALVDQSAQASLQLLQEALNALAPSRRGDDTKAAAGAAAAALPPALQRLVQLLEEGTRAPLSDDHVREVRVLLTDLQPIAPAPASTSIHEAFETCETFLDTVGFDTLAAELLLDHVRAAVSSWPATENSPATVEKPRPKRVEQSAGSAAESRTVRVPEKHIDAFLRHVGELLVVRDMFEHLRQRVAQNEPAEVTLPSFSRANQTFALLADELRRSIMSIRLVPMRALLQKAPRLVRDIAQTKGKKIDVKLLGESLELDKSLTDLLDAPLTHMVRNAADHGVEPVDQRLAAGKPETGTICISADIVGEQVVLVVSDDGAGLDYDALRSKAQALGLIQAGRPLTEQETIALLFRSGVSTAKEVTDISGRGVGMDVVRQAIEQAGGSIHVTSERGKGSRFEVRLPKTVITQIMPGYVVQVGGLRYVLPLSRVREATASDGLRVETLPGGGRCTRHHDRVIPLLSLRHTLGLPEATDAASPTLVSLDLGSREVLAEVDSALGIQQVVLREIEGLSDSAGLVRGGALMGDGTVALVLDVDALEAA